MTATSSTQKKASRVVETWTKTKKTVAGAANGARKGIVGAARHVRKNRGKYATGAVAATLLAIPVTRPWAKEVASTIVVVAVITYTVVVSQAIIAGSTIRE